MNKYPRLTKMPYYGTEVSEITTKQEIIKLLEKYGIEDHQWTKMGGQENVKFIFDTIVQGKQIKIGVQFDIPIIRAKLWQGSGYRIVDVPKAQVYRIFYYSLKSLLEITQYGIMKKEDLFFSYIITQLPDGTRGRMKDLLKEEYHFLLPESPGQMTDKEDK